MRINVLPTLGVVGLIAILPFIGAYPIFIMKIMCYALFACAFNLMLGFTGLLSFGHAAFLGASGYFLGHALVVWNWSTLGAITGAVLISAMLGLVVGGIAIRRSGIFFAMITLALSQMVYFYFLQAPFTHGEDGLQGIPRGSIFGLDLSNDLTLYYFVLVLTLFGYYVYWRTVNSPFGRILVSIRENEPRAISLGYSVSSFKLIVFVLSAALAGLAGASKALVFVSATLSDADWRMSGMAIIMTLIGGVGTFTGPIVGAVVIVILENKIGDIGRFLADLTGFGWFNALGQSVPMIIGFIFIVSVLLFRQGVVGELKQRLSRHN